MMLRRAACLFLLVTAASFPFVAACGGKDAPTPAVAAGSVQLGRDKAPLGSPLEVTIDPASYRAVC